MTTLTDTHRPTAGTVEDRHAPVTDTLQVDGPRLRGRIPYGVESRDMDGWREVIEPGALSGARLDDLVATVDHAGVPIGRHPRTLELEDRSDGLHWSVDLPESRSDVREAVERGDLRSGSWRMIVGRDEWRGDVRHVHEIAELRDVAVVTIGAYTAAATEYRAAPEQTPEAAPAAQDTPEAEEAPMQTTDRESGPGLAVEDRTADAPTIEQRVLDGLRSVRKGEARSLTTSTADPIAPPELSTFLFDRLRASSVALRSGIRVIATDRESIQWPQITADMVPGWYAELDPIVASDPTFATLTATPKKLAARVEMSNEVVDDSDPSILDVLNGHVAQILALRLDLGVFEGNQGANANSIKGLKYVAGIQVVDMGLNGAAMTDHDAFLEAIGLLRAANVAPPYVAVMHPRTATDLSLLKDADGNQLGAPAGMPSVLTTTQLSTSETKGISLNASSVYIYAPSELVLVRRQDVAIELDRSRLFDQDASELRGRLRADLLTPNPQAVVRIEGVTPAA
jgi:HK97 family phage major capsid protein